MMQSSMLCYTIVQHNMILHKSHPRFGRFPKFHRVFLGRDPGTLKSDIANKKTSTINLFGFETQIENSKIEIMETDRI